MQISDEQVKIVREQMAKARLVSEIQEMDLPLETYPRPEDAELMAQVTKSVVEMPDREDRIAELKARIEAGTYEVSGDQIVDAMIRRSIADKMR